MTYRDKSCPSCGTRNQVHFKKCHFHPDNLPPLSPSLPAKEEKMPLRKFKIWWQVPAIGGHPSVPANDVDTLQGYCLADCLKDYMDSGKLLSPAEGSLHWEEVPLVTLDEVLHYYRQISPDLRKLLTTGGGTELKWEWKAGWKHGWALGSDPHTAETMENWIVISPAGVPFFYNVDTKAWTTDDGELDLALRRIGLLGLDL